MPSTEGYTDADARTSVPWCMTPSLWERRYHMVFRTTSNCRASRLRNRPLPPSSNWYLLYLVLGIGPNFWNRLIGNFFLWIIDFNRLFSVNHILHSFTIWSEFHGFTQKNVSCPWKSHRDWLRIDSQKSGWFLVVPLEWFHHDRSCGTKYVTEPI